MPVLLSGGPIQPREACGRRGGRRECGYGCRSSTVAEGLQHRRRVVEHESLPGQPGLHRVGERGLRGTAVPAAAGVGGGGESLGTEVDAIDTEQPVQQGSGRRRWNGLARRSHSAMWSGEIGLPAGRILGTGIGGVL